MQVLELADEFNLTSVEAAEICVAAGVVDATALTDLSDGQVERWRTLATARREWLERDDRGTPVGVAATSTFGPLPAAPWETSAAAGSRDAPGGPPWVQPRKAPVLGPGASPDGRPAAVTPYAPAALALAVVSIVFPFIPGFGALALAWYAKDRIERSDGRLTGQKLAIAAQVVAGISIGLWTLLLAFSIYRDIRSEAADDGQVETGQLAWDEIGPGQCVRIPRADLAVNTWTGVDCAAPHEAEVYAAEVIAPTTSRNEPYPGRASLIPGATRLCEERFAAYVGIPYAESELRIAVYFPSGSNWSVNDDRTIGCIVFREDYALIDGALAQSGS